MLLSAIFYYFGVVSHTINSKKKNTTRSTLPFLFPSFLLSFPMGRRGYLERRAHAAHANFWEEDTSRSYAYPSTTAARSVVSETTDPFDSAVKGLISSADTTMKESDLAARSRVFGERPPAFAAAVGTAVIDLMECSITDLENIGATLRPHTVHMRHGDAVSHAYADLLSVQTRMSEHVLNAYS